MNIEQMKEKISKMSDIELQMQVDECRTKMSHMVAFTAEEVAICAILEAELKARKENGNS